MNTPRSALADRIQAFVDSPITNLLKGLALLLIGLTDASRTFRDDIAHKRVRLGHGLIIIGIFSMLGALPQIIESLEATDRYLKLRDEKKRSRDGTDKP